MNAQPAAASSSPHAIAAVYADRMRTLQQAEKRLQREHLRLGYLRLAFGLATLAFLVPPTFWALGPVLGFAVAAREHGAVLRALAGTRRTLAFYQRAVARLEDRWAILDVPEPTFDTSASLYAADLDLFGQGSLFALLCEARTSLGRDRLAHWLLQPAAFDQLRQRHRALTELREHLPLREAFAAAPGPAVAKVDRDRLVAWGNAAAPGLPGALAWAAPILVLLTLLAAWRFAAVHSPLLLIGRLVVDGALSFRYRHVTRTLFGTAEAAAQGLRTIAPLLGCLEQTAFRGEDLQARVATLAVDGATAAKALARLQHLGVWAEARSNIIVRLLNSPFLYSLQLALALQRWRGHYGPHLPLWLDTLAEMEALLSLSADSVEHPQDPLPQLTTADGEAPSFLAEGLGHPLLPSAVCVRNDVQLDATTRLLLVSGSNMSGKSTLLRSVGANAVLAFAGAPVRAYALKISPLTLAASIHVNDSLQAGRSRFYSEILRLRAITEVARDAIPALFLVDELLAGTNSSDRLAGAQGLITEWLKSGALGLLSTHDLALTALAGTPGAAVRNVHFEDDISDGQLRFDYTLREGPVTRSNGLALMRLIGLKV